MNDTWKKDREGREGGEGGRGKKRIFQKTDIGLSKQIPSCNPAHM